MITEKQCRKCHETKPLDEYYQDHRNKDGHYSYCKKCQRALNVTNYARRYDTEPEYKEKLLAYQAAYQQKSQYLSKVNVDPEECSLMRELYYLEDLTHKEVARITGRAHRTAVKHINGECNCNC